MSASPEKPRKAAGDADGIRLRQPDAADGYAVWQLIAACPPLDQNSVYCNLLQCSDFADTCVLAQRDDELVGWISAYLPPDEPDTLFVWQVAVRDTARGVGLAGRMLTELLQRPACDNVVRLKTTITPDNTGSFALFRSFAERVAAPFSEAPGFDQHTHFNGLHDSERLITIGPIPDKERSRRQSLSAA